MRKKDSSQTRKQTIRLFGIYSNQDMVDLAKEFEKRGYKVKRLKGSVVPVVIFPNRCCSTGYDNIRARYLSD